MENNTSIKKLLVKQKDKAIIVNHRDIIYLESMSNYTKVKLFDGTEITSSICLKQSMKEITDGFYRISQSFIVNLHYVKEIISKDRLIITTNGESLKYTVSYFELCKRLEASI